MSLSVFNGLLYGGDMAPRLTKSRFIAPTAGSIARWESVRFNPDFSLGGGVTLGSLRQFMAEIADWPDDSWVDAGTFEVHKGLPLATLPSGESST